MLPLFCFCLFQTLLSTTRMANCPGDSTQTHLDILRCPFLRNINEPTNLSFSSSSLPFPFPVSNHLNCFFFLILYLYPSIRCFLLTNNKLLSRCEQGKDQFLRMDPISTLRLGFSMVKMVLSRSRTALVPERISLRFPLLGSIHLLLRRRLLVSPPLDMEGLLDSMRFPTCLRTKRESQTLPKIKILLPLR